MAVVTLVANEAAVDSCCLMRSEGCRYGSAPPRSAAAIGSPGVTRGKAEESEDGGRRS